MLLVPLKYKFSGYLHQLVIQASDISVLVEVSRSLLLFLKRFVLLIVLLCRKQINESESESIKKYRSQSRFVLIYDLTADLSIMPVTKQVC